MVSPHPLPTKVSGAKHSVKLSTFYTSSGILSLDAILSGGISAGTITLIESDFHETYAKQIINLFVAEGIVSGHSLLYGAKEQVEQLLVRLPDISEPVSTGSSSEDDLRIAWRYKHIGDVEKPSISSTTLGHHFDLASSMNTSERIKEKDLEVVNFSPNSHESLAKNLSDLIISIQKFLTLKTSTNIQRVALSSVFTPAWGHCNGTVEFEKTILWFLATLRLLIQRTLCVVYINIPSFLTGPLLSRMRHYADYGYSITGFDGRSEKNEVYSDFDGLFTVIKLPWLGGSLEPINRPETLQWAFKIKRRQFVLQQLHLPPCLSDTVSRSNAPETVLSCGQKPNSAVDF